MTTEFPVTLHVPDLRPRDGSLRGIWNHLVQNMVASSETILDAETELPTSLRVGNIVVTASPSADYTQTLQDKDGTVALLEDVHKLRPTVILREGLVSVDWEESNNFLCVLSGNRESVFYMTHPITNTEISLLLINNGINQVISTWDPVILWPNGTAPTMPAASIGGSALLQVTIRNFDDDLLGESTPYAFTQPWPLT